MRIDELVGTPADQQGNMTAPGAATPATAAPKPGEPMGAMDPNSPEAQKAKQEQKKNIQAQIKATQAQLKTLQQQLRSIK